jgi:hypothetical protein
VPDLAAEAEHPHDLGHPCAGGALAGLEQGLRLDGFAEELDHRGVLGSLGGLGLPLGGGTALTTRSAATRRFRTPMLPFSKAPLGPRAISTVCSR